MARIKKLRLASLLEVFFDACMSLAFMAQAFVASCLLIYGYLPIPSEWGNQHIAKNLPPGIILTIDEIRLRSDASIELVGIELGSVKIEQTLFRADAAELKLKWSGFKKTPRAESLLISGGTLFAPSVYSSDGYHSPLLKRIAFRLINNDDNWKVDRFAALHENIHLRGSFDLPAFKKDNAEALDIDAAINNFYTQAATLSQQKERISYFLTPTLAFRSSHLDADTQEIELRITSRHMQHAEVNAKNIQLLGIVQLTEDKLIPISAPRLTADYLELPRFGLTAQSLSAEFPRDDFDGLLSGKWPRLKLAAKQLNVHELELLAPTLQIDSKAYPLLSFYGASSSLKGAVDLSGQLNAENRSGQINARGSLDLVTLLPDELAKKIPKIIYESPPYYELKLNLTEGFVINHADLKAQVQTLGIDELTFDHVYAHASYANGFYLIEDLYLRRQQQWLDLTFSFDPVSSDYRASLIGSTVPKDYNSLLPSWWAAIFENIDFSRTDFSLADFIIYGNTQRKSPDLYYGHAEASKLSYMGVAINEAELIVRGRDSYCELHALNARSGQAWARGDIALTTKRDAVKGPLAIRLDMEAQLALTDAAKLFKSDLATIIADFETASSPAIKLEAVIFNKAYPKYAGKSYFDLSADLNLPLTYKGVPLDHLSFKLFGRSEVTHLREVELGYADGQASAMIDIFMPAETKNSLRYELALKDADQNQALHGLPQLDKIEDSLENTKLIQKTKTGRETARVDLHIRGQGPIEDPLKHKGIGHFEIHNDKLGTIQLLGPLSEILQHTQLSFTSFKLNTMRGDFRYENDLVTFDPLRIDGAFTQIKAPGTLSLRDQALNMNVNVKLFGNVGRSDSNIRKIGELITKPIPNLLQFELTGTLKDQKLRSLYDPRNLIQKF
jgi:hypothetical protein